MSKQRRRRGVVLTPEGLQKLQRARLELENKENFGERYTLEKLSELTTLDLHTIKRILAGKQGVDKRSLERFFIAFYLELTENYYTQPNPNKRQDWGEAICVSDFYGRTEELAILEKWIFGNRCRMITLLGMGGIGKSCLSVKLAQQVQDKLDCLIWRSLRDAPPFKDMLANLIQFLSNEQETQIDLPENEGERISLLLKYMRSLRCLIVLDNLESLLCSNGRAGVFRKGYEGYGELLRRVGETDHQSCLLLTTREKPKQIALLDGEKLLVRTLRLNGFKEQEGEKILEAKGVFGTEAEQKTLIECYASNALALKIVATTIRDLFKGSISEFLRQNTTIFGDIRDLLDEQFQRLSDFEKEIMYWLAINREPITLSKLREDMVVSVPQTNLLEELESLLRRSLIEQYTVGFTLQSIVMEYVTSQLIEEVCQEITISKLKIFRCSALMKATAKDYIREIQSRLILQPVIDKLLTIFRSQKEVENHLNQIIKTLQETSPLEPGYTVGNILNLLCQIKTDIRRYDFSNLCIWQADLRCACLHDVNFQNSDLAKSVFAETFGGVLSVALSPDGKLLTMGDINGEISLRKVVDGQLIYTLKGHTDWVTSLAFNTDSRVLASGSQDHTIKLWDVSTGQCLKTLQGHSDEVWSVNLSSDSQTLVSGSDDHTIKLWDVSSGQCLKTLQGHKSWICSVVLSPDSQTLVSGSDDHTIKLWDVSSGQCLKTLQGHSDGIRSVAVNSDGQMLVSGSDDHTIKLWDVSSGQCLKTFQGHTNEVYSIAFGPQDDIIASGSFDQTVKLWSISSGQCFKTLYGHSSWVFSIAFSLQDDIIASGSFDQTAKLWNIRTGQCLKTFQGYTNQVFSIDFNPDGKMLASGSHDFSVRLWDINTGQCLKTFKGHQASVQSIAFSPDGKMLASGSYDNTVRLWNVSTGQCLKTLQGHRAAIWSVAFNPDGKMLASGALDQKVKLWDISTGDCKRTLEEYKTWVWSVAFSQDGELLASASPDGTIRLWSVRTDECKRILQANSACLNSVVFSADNRILASGGNDNTVRLWDVSTGQCIKTFQGHTGGVWSVIFSPEHHILASSSDDETIRLWNVITGDCIKTLKAEKPYDGINIKWVKSLTETTIASLKTLGAVLG